MMRGLFWLSLGATLAVLIMRRIARIGAKLTPQGLAANLGAGLSELASSLGSFTAEVRAAMADRESELRTASGLDGGTTDPSSAASTDSGAHHREAG